MLWVRINRYSRVKRRAKNWRPRTKTNGRLTFRKMPGGAKLAICRLEKQYTTCAGSCLGRTAGNGIAVLRDAAGLSANRKHDENPFSAHFSLPLFCGPRTHHVGLTVSRCHHSYSAPERGLGLVQRRDVTFATLSRIELSAFE
jgi:hypothetical protein